MSNFWKTFDGPQAESTYNSYKSILASPSTLSLAYQRKTSVRKKFFVPHLDHLSKTEELLNMAEDFKGMNPFISRRVLLWYDFKEGPEPHMDYWSNVLPMLKRFGKELHTLKIIYRSRYRTGAMLARLKECLELMPQITNLSFCFMSIHPGNNEAMPILGLPTCPKLEQLSISFARAPLHYPFSVYFDQLTSLEIRGETSFMKWYDSDIHSTFPKLERLAVYVNNPDELFKIHCLSGPLGEVEIRGRMANLHPLILFHVVKNFQETLCSFKIQRELHCEVKIKSMKNCGLKARSPIYLPELKTLSINILKCGYGPVVSLLMQLSNPPEYLEIMLEECPHHKDKTEPEAGTTVVQGRDEKVAIQILECWENMYTSNIWELWPSLQRIYVWVGPTPLPGLPKPGEGIYTREKLEYGRRMKTKEAQRN